MIERKKKPCKVCGKDKYIWSKGRCKPCSAKDYKLKKTPIKYKKKETGELEFMKQVWEERHHICEECNVYLPEFSPFCMAHILGKGAAPEHRLNKNNIMILCPTHHMQWDAGDKKTMKIFTSKMKIVMGLKRESSER